MVVEASKLAAEFRGPRAPFEAYARALHDGTLGELMRHDEVGGSPVRDWCPATDPIDVLVAMALFEGGDEEFPARRATRRVVRRRGSPETRRCGTETASIRVAPGVAIVWWHREGWHATPGARQARIEEWVVVGFSRSSTLWRVRIGGPARGRRAPTGAPQVGSPVCGARESTAAG